MLSHHRGERLSLPASLWAATAEPAAETPPAQRDAHAEVAIVGAGYTGLSAAVHLAEAGKDVVVLEAGEPGWGASGRNGGQVIPGLKWDPDELATMLGPDRGERITAIAGSAPDLVFSLIARHAIRCDAVRTGWIQAIHSERKLSLAEARVAQWQRRGADVALLGKAEMASKLGADAYAGGWIDRRGGNLQPLSYARGLARAGIAAGARIHGQTPALKLRRNGGWSVETPNATITAEQVLVCTNGYTGDLVPGLKQSIVPLNSFQVATAPLSENVRRSILPGGEACSDTRRLLAYFRLDRDGRLLMGGRGSPWGETRPGRYERLRRMLHRLFPQAGLTPFQFYWSGKVAMTADHLPHVHEPAPGLCIGLGYNGRGVAMATMMGKLLAERILGAPEDVFGLPVSRVQPLPLWTLRQPALALLVQWYRLRDALD